MRAVAIHVKRHRGRQIQHRTVGVVDGAETAFLRDRRQVARDVAGGVGLDDLRRPERRAVVRFGVGRLAHHPAGDELEQPRVAHHPVVVGADQRTAGDARAERGRTRDLHRRAAETRGQVGEGAARFDRAANDRVLRGRPVVLKRGRQTMIGAQLAGDLDEIQVPAPLARHRRVVDGLILLNPAIGPEEPDAVAQDRAAQCGVGLNVAPVVRRDAFDVAVVEPLRNHEERERAVQLVAAALGDDVHELPDHARAVRGLGAKRLDLHILNRLVIQVDREDVAAKRVGHVHAVDARAPLGSAGLLRVGSDVHARHHQPDILEAPVGRHRHRGQRRVVDVDREPGALGIDQRAFTLHGDRLGQRADGQRDVHLCHRAQPNGLLPDDRLEAFELGANRIGGRRQVGDAVIHLWRR